MLVDQPRGYCTAADAAAGLCMSSCYICRTAYPCVLRKVNLNSFVRSPL